MSGTSADGIDGALVRLPEAPALVDVREVVHRHVPFTREQRETVFRLFDTAHASVEDVSRANFQVGEWFARAALATIDAAGLRPEDVDLIGSHGQTIFHEPPGVHPQGIATTLQIGEPAVIAERTGITTVADFRVRDVAAGGHGAPLVSYVDELLFRHATTTRVVLNLGGIANVTILFPANDPRPPLAFDTGPANMVLDWLAGHLTDGQVSYDEGGDMAAAGTADNGLLEALLADPYFRAAPPKTTGRERYGAAYAQKVLEAASRRRRSTTDVMATALALTARTVGEAITGEVGDGPLEVIAGGGGTRNTTLMRALQERLPGARVMTHEDVGVSSQAKEALSFAILASQAIRGRHNTVTSCTGATHAVVMGKILPGRNYAALMRRLFG